MNWLFGERNLTFEKIRNRTAVVTGAATGMGRSLAMKLVENGVSGLALCDVNETELMNTVKACQDLRSASKQNDQGKPLDLKVTSHVVDVANEEAVKRFRDEVVEKHDGKVHFLFNNAGICVDGRMVYPNSWDEEQVARTEQNWDKCFNVNFYGVLYMTRAFLPTLIAQDEAYLVSTSSLNGLWVWPFHTPYCASKAAVKGLSESLMVEMKLKHPHVHVCCLHPGGVRTEIANNTIASFDQRKLTDDHKSQMANGFAQVADLSADEAADWILDAVVKGKTRVLVGYDAIAIDAIVRLFPSFCYSIYDTLGAMRVPTELEEITGQESGQDNENVTFGSKALKFLRVLFGGGWLYVLFLSWTIPMRLRRLLPGNVNWKVVVAGLLLAIGVKKLRLRSGL